MNAENLKSKITFEVRAVGGGMLSLTGKLAVCSVMKYDGCEIKPGKDYRLAMAEMKEQVRERIMRIIYDDQREELYGAVDDLLRANPMDYAAMGAAREKILKAAKRQKP